jgi:hypothetical protein
MRRRRPAAATAHPESATPGQILTFNLCRQAPTLRLSLWPSGRSSAALDDTCSSWALPHAPGNLARRAEEELLLTKAIPAPPQTSKQATP